MRSTGRHPKKKYYYAYELNVIDFLLIRKVHTNGPG